MPVFLLDVCLNEGDYSGNDRVVHCLSKERKTRARSHRDVPFALFGILVLAGEELKEHWHDFRKCDLGKVPGSLDITVKETLRSRISRT